MKRPLLLALAFVLLAMLARPAKAEVTFSFFYENLSPHGDWVEVADYGYCWQPRGVTEEWAPYTDGYWAYTDAGWTWVSYEEFGPITYHYGRWARLDGYGWVWKPDYEWGPAWVSWRSSDEYVGWAPLPPEVPFVSGVGISIWVDRDYDIGPGYYNFCDVRYFGSPVVRNVIVPRSRNTVIINKTVNITNITYNDNRKWVYNGGPDYRKISARSERRIERLRLDRRTGGFDHKSRVERSRRDGNRLIVAAPEVRRDERGVPPPKKVAKRIEKPRVDRGWSHVKDRSERERIEKKIEAETRGTRRGAPAKPVNEAEVESTLNAPEPPRNDRRRDEDRRSREKAERSRDENRQRSPEQEQRQQAERSRDEASKRSREQEQLQQTERSRDEASKPSREQEQGQQAERSNEAAKRSREQEQPQQAERSRDEARQRSREQEQRQQTERSRDEAAKRSREQEQRQKAERSRDEARQRSREQEQRQQAERSRDEARQRSREQEQRQQAERSRDEATKRSREQEQRQQAERSRDEARQRSREQEQRQKAERSRDEARQRSREQEQQRQKAERSREKAERSRDSDRQQAERSRQEQPKKDRDDRKKNKKEKD